MRTMCTQSTAKVKNPFGASSHICRALCGHVIKWSCDHVVTIPPAT